MDGQQLALGVGETSGADLSICGTYRYDLWRRWCDGPWALWIMLNPSTADADVDDPTIRRCRGFSKAWGYGGLAVVNLFAYRATIPDELTRVRDPRGPLNKQRIKLWLDDHRTSAVIAAWGTAWRKVDQPRLNVEGMAREAGHDVFCLGTTKRGHPRHPLYVRADQALVPFGADR